VLTGKSAVLGPVVDSIRLIRIPAVYGGMLPDGAEPNKWTALIDFPLPRIYH